MSKVAGIARKGFKSKAENVLTAQIKLKSIAPRHCGDQCYGVFKEGEKVNN